MLHSLHVGEKVMSDKIFPVARNQSELPSSHSNAKEDVLKWIDLQWSLLMKRKEAIERGSAIANDKVSIEGELKMLLLTKNWVEENVRD
jgi:hypothetical protein